MSMSETGAERLLVLAPVGRDASLAGSVLSESGIDVCCCTSMDNLLDEISRGAGGIVVAQEALDTDSANSLLEVLQNQPAWSDLPVLVLTGHSVSIPRAGGVSLTLLHKKSNVTLLERPVRIVTFVSAARSMLRARWRQYEVRDLLSELERAVASRDNFMAMLGHELRNPLGAIRMAVQLLGEDEKDGDSESLMRTALPVIARQAHQLTRLVDDLLDVSRVTRGKIALQKQRLDFVELVRHVVESNRTNAGALRHELLIRLPEDPLYIEADAFRMEQVISNLLVNAVKYTPPGGRIEVRLRSDRVHGGAVLEVCDNGSGIPEGLIDRIFEPFGQADRTLDRAQGGLGLGLTLARDLARMHGGDVLVRSKGAGHGCTFTVSIPLSSCPDEETTELPPRKADPVTTKVVSTDLKPMHVLIVEDHRDSRETLRALLRRRGFTVELAEDGNQGLEQALSGRPHVALVDIGLPGLDGYNFAKRLREEIGDDVYLIALTGYGQPEDRQNALDAGFNEHLVKPVDPGKLIETLEEIDSRKNG